MGSEVGRQRTCDLGQGTQGCDISLGQRRLEQLRQHAVQGGGPHAKDHTQTCECLPGLWARQAGQERGDDRIHRATRPSPEQYSEGSPCRLLETQVGLSTATGSSATKLAYLMVPGEPALFCWRSRSFEHQDRSGAQPCFNVWIAAAGKHPERAQTGQAGRC